MSFLYDNIAPIAVAAMVSLVAWLFGGARGDLLVPVVPWVFVLMLEVIFCFPQRQKGESIYDARARVWQTFRTSPIFWTCTGLLVLLLVPFVNNGLCPGCDAARIAEGIDPRPHVPILPFCVDRMDHLSVVLGFAVVLTAVVAVRICLRWKGRRLVLKLLVWNGTALALLGFVQAAAGAPGPFWTALYENPATLKGAFFSTFGYPNMAGDYFTLLFGISVALWRDQYEEMYQETRRMDPTDLAVLEENQRGRFWHRHIYLVPAALFFFAAVNTLSRAAILLVTSTACVYFIHTLSVLLSRLHKSRRVYAGAWSCLGLLLLVFVAALFMPEDVQREVRTLDNIAVLDRVTGKAHYHSQVATSIWGDHVLFGCGGWGYKHFCVPKMKELKIRPSKLQVVGGANAHNDYLQFLAEHGAVGLGALAALVILLFRPVGSQWKILSKAARFHRGKSKLPPPVQLFSLPSAAFVILIACGATLVHAATDCPFRSVAVASLFFTALAALPDFMPRRTLTQF